MAEPEDNRESETQGQPEPDATEEPSYFVVALSDFFQAYATHKQFLFTPVPWSQKIRNVFRAAHITAASFLGLRDRNAPHEFIHVHTEKPDPSAGLLRDLMTGTLVAIGYPMPRVLDDKAVVIPSEFWFDANPDFEQSRLSSAGFEFAQVQVLVRFTSGYPELEYISELTNRPIPKLASFQPSDKLRERYSFPASHTASDDEPVAASIPACPPQKPDGRPTLRDDIIAAFHACDKDLNWSNKQLAAAIRQRVKDATGKLDDKGLGDDAILKHVKPLWQAFKTAK